MVSWQRLPAGPIAKRAGEPSRTGPNPWRAREAGATSPDPFLRPFWILGGRGLFQVNGKLGQLLLALAPAPAGRPGFVHRLCFARRVLGNQPQWVGAVGMRAMGWCMHMPPLCARSEQPSACRCGAGPAALLSTGRSVAQVCDSSTTGQRWPAGGGGFTGAQMVRQENNRLPDHPDQAACSPPLGQCAGQGARHESPGVVRRPRPEIMPPRGKTTFTECMPPLFPPVVQVTH